MPEKLTEYRVMLHPSGGLEGAVKEQLQAVALTVYSTCTDETDFCVKTVEKPTKPRHLFTPGNGDVPEIEVFPHITL